MTQGIAAFRNIQQLYYSMSNSDLQNAFLFLSSANLFYLEANAKQMVYIWKWKYSFKCGCIEFWMDEMGSYTTKAPFQTWQEKTYVR